jgi:hypothetical protein
MGVSLLFDCLDGTCFTGMLRDQATHLSTQQHAYGRLREPQPSCRSDAESIAAPSSAAEEGRAVAPAAPAAPEWSPRRWLMLTLYSLVAMLNFGMWLTYASLPVQAAEAFPEAWMGDSLSVVVGLGYLLGAVPAGRVLSSSSPGGLRRGLLYASILAVISGVLRWFGGLERSDNLPPFAPPPPPPSPSPPPPSPALPGQSYAHALTGMRVNEDNPLPDPAMQRYSLVLVGQLLVGLAQPFFMAVPRAAIRTASWPFQQRSCAAAETRVGIAVGRPPRSSPRTGSRRTSAASPRPSRSRRRSSARRSSTSLAPPSPTSPPSSASKRPAQPA